MHDLLTVTYGLGGIIAALFHVPQLRRLWCRPESVQGIAAASWCGWLAISANSLAYAVLVNGDPALVYMTGLGMVCQCLMLLFMARARLLLRRGGADGAATAAGLA
ncbi:MAG TPA: hypothetical protein VEB20_25840 [Azospirillaceae bacterium]|nr:hypothetical protein [Azospirillaceae bacterium]